VRRELDGLVDLDNVVILAATRTHRANDGAELCQMFGDEVVDSIRIVNSTSTPPWRLLAASVVTWRGGCRGVDGARAMSYR
jgi:nickel-dependent lactate racemase